MNLDSGHLELWLLFHVSGCHTLWKLQELAVCNHSDYHWLSANNLYALRLQQI